MRVVRSTKTLRYSQLEPGATFRWEDGGTGPICIKLAGGAYAYLDNGKPFDGGSQSDDFVSIVHGAFVEGYDG